MRFGITGHQRLDDPAQWQWVREQLGRIFIDNASPGDEALTSLAVGADTMFAKVAIEHGLRLSLVIPCQHYEDTFSASEDFDCYRQLRARAQSELVLDHAVPSEEAFEHAGRVVVAQCDLLVTVWNGKPAAGRGGTGDIVEWARLQGRKMVWLEPKSRRVLA